MERGSQLNLVDSAGCRIAYCTSGNARGPAVLFIHSLGLDHSSWRAEAERFGRQYQVIQIDVRGHGQSDAPAGPYTLEEIGLDVIAVADQLDINRFHVVGLSIGGLTALWLAIHQAQRLLSAAYCNTAAKLGNHQLWNARIEAVQGGMATVAESALPRFFTPAFAGRDPRLFERVRQTFLSTDRNGYAGCCVALRDADLRSEVDKIQMPSLIIGGEEDLATPPADSRWLHEHIPNSEFVLIEEAAHLSNLEQPEAFAEALVRHLRRN